jgi:hypothetical protein
MRKQSFLALSLLAVLFFTSCTKEDLQPNSSTPPNGTSYQDPFEVVSYSNWTADANLTWSDGATDEPSRQFDLEVPELTAEQLNNGSFVLLYARSEVDGSVKPMPADFSDVNNDEINLYAANYEAGVISLMHTKTVSGNFEIPDDNNQISFRYIIVKPNTPNPNGRPMTSYDFLGKPYDEVINLLAIPN